MSETDFLKLKKHDNVETNTEKFDIENYLNGNWNKINENAKKVNTDILNINSKNKEQDTNIKQLQGNTKTSSNKIAELEKELKEAQEDFYQNSIRGQASGEYIHVEDSSNCRAKIGIGGNHEQDMRSGKNYLNTLAKYKAGEKVTVDGITYIFNEDGSITCNGTATADSVLTFSLGLQTINGSSKKIVGMLTGTQVPKKLSILAYTSDWSKNTFTLLSNVNKNITTNMQENIDYTIFRIIVYKETTLNNQTIYYQILDTSVNDLTYEQYGAMPSPDYKSEIESVGSNVNLFAGGDTVTNNGVTFTKNKDDSYDIVGMATEQANCINFVDIQNSGIINGNIYNIHVSENLPDGVKILIEAYNDTAWIRHVLGSSLIPNVSKANIENVNKIRFTLRVEKGISVNIHNLRIKLEKDTIETAYSKYGQGCVKVTKCNKNILNIEDIDETEKNGIKYSVKNGILKLNGTATASFDIQLSKNIKIKKGKYTHSSSYIQPGLYISFNNLGYTIISAQVGKKRTFEITEDTTYKSYFIWIDKGTVLNNVEIKLQLEAGTTVTDFIEHQSQSVIMLIQQEMLEGDYFDFDNEEEVHTKAKLVLTGNENWKLESTGRFGIIKSDLPEIPAATSNGNDYLGNMCNSYKESTPVLTWKKVQGFCVDMSSCLRIYDDKYSTNNDLEGFKTYLKSKYDAGTPVIIYYKLQTPTRLKFTDEQKAVAKELNNARTYKNVTNITTDSKAILSLDYAKDLETLLNNTQALAVNNASEGV
jgi:hypothetical protein|nr:MAG TPA: hypothetical protein [Caudoviricetes sp.]